MQPDRDVKKWFKGEASKNPDKYYATSVLKGQGFMRKHCSCGTYFWTVNAEQTVCGDSACSGGYRFIGNSPAKRKLDYIQAWQEFSSFFKKRGYTPIKRYPVAARWRDDTDFVQASIYDFQPYVVSGEVAPPANPLVVPQFCLRFKDIDNVGITGGHYTGFVMIGQHAFMEPAKFNQAQYFTDILEWLTKGLGIPVSEITFHEDAWAGGGNFGPCMEYFSRGLELGNQVYMMFQQTEAGNRELNLKVLDMGMGQERNAWFSLGKATSYMTTFPTVLDKLLKKTGVEIDAGLMQKFVPLSSSLNVDEAKDIAKAWADVSRKIGMKPEELKVKIHELAALFSVAEHSRSLLVALSDGVLPSNVAGGYNLRVLLRRALSFIQEYGWDIELADVCSWHASYLKPQFPELSENLADVQKILDVEKRKYQETRERSVRIVEKALQGRITSESLLELYDSHGISPEQVLSAAKKMHKDVDVPADFYAQVAELHDKQRKKQKGGKSIELEGVPETIALYYDDYALTRFSAKVLRIIGNQVVLDKTIFYPTSGGQASDTGTINGCQVTAVFKQGGVIIHTLQAVPFKEGETVNGEIDLERRKQLAQHHTAAHIVNGACRKILGNHIWQAGADKQIDKARLDITHYDQLSKEEQEQIEGLCNETIKKNLPVKSSFMQRDEAELKYGFRLYQGGAVPGKKIRVIEIPGFDIEACGGTHLHRTGEAERIKILKSSKIQDGVLRLEFAAGRAAQKEGQEQEGILNEASELLGCEPDQVPGRAKELFEQWKAVVKKKRDIGSCELSCTDRCTGDALSETAAILCTQPEHVPKTIKRFLNELRGRDKEHRGSKK